MNLIFRSRMAAAPLAIALTLTMGLGASAQVATLSGPDETPEPPDSDAGSLEFADREEAVLAFTQCLRDNGIDIDDPVAGVTGGRGFLRGGPDQAGGVDPFSEEFQIAQATCGEMLEAARPEIDPALQQERLEEELLLAQCLRESGFPEYPDPTLDNDGRLQRGGQQFQDVGIDRRSEAFQTARSGCADDLGVEAFGPGAGPAGPGGN